jgi:hypothetical protein
MKSIGFRATPTEVIYCVIEKKGKDIIVDSVDKIKLPTSQGFPEQLSFLRTNIKDIIRENQITKAGIRTTENSSRNWSIPRIHIEGVIQELFCRSNIEAYFIGISSNITSKLGIKVTDFKKIISKEINSCSNVDLGNFNDKQRESILVAIAAINLEK